ncbi:MAG: hypothetical protein V4662_13295 [Verrucomicrobiota bacterium]
MILPLTAVSVACVRDMNRQRVPAWQNAFVGGFVALFFFAFHDISMAEHHPHMPRILEWLVGVTLSVLMLLPSAITVWVHRKFMSGQRSSEENSKP